MPDAQVKIRVGTTDEAEMRRISVELRSHGFRLQRILAPLGMMTGDVDSAQIEALRDCDGVESVEPESGVQSPPFEPGTPQ